MKKLSLLLMIVSFGFAGFAQGNGKSKNKTKKAQKKHQQAKKQKKQDADSQYPQSTRNNDDDRSEGKYTKNAPRKVRDAFYRDFPNANKVSWTKNRSIWTAHYGNSGIFGGNRTASYKANGQRVNTNNNQVINKNDDRNKADRRTRTGDPVLDQVLGRD